MSKSFPGDNRDDPAQCSCGDLTMAGFSANQYWPYDEHGVPTGHHPQCRYHEPPPRFAYAEERAKAILKNNVASTVDAQLAHIILDLVTFLAARFPDAKADGRT